MLQRLINLFIFLGMLTGLGVLQYYNTKDEVLQKTMAAIAKIESQNAEHPYRLLGKATKNGDRAYGKYQIMCKNIPSWTKEALGKKYSCKEFLNNSWIQEQTASFHLKKLIQKYGPSGAARAWFAGEGGMNHMKNKDNYGTSVKIYNERFLRYYGE